MTLWIILLIVVMLVAFSGASYGYASRPMDGPYPVYMAPLGGLASLLLIGLVVLFILGAMNGMEGFSIDLPRITVD
ncbi:hypothetical protein DTL21_14600 [Bremerella cremea]|uniref:Uncharacterized protein n=1 Tax=Blastopirellula marina TaxID=124 RepID=A0A2S8FRF2_9BACT|nr:MULTISPECIES: hypothetical protein [Pirellulaceae]PQO34727.1 hypothetical protein C5Y83_14595 [Blastopirellula marina]RCS47225.1 hypothetical protein DTL21_14600 [Bremerella cremea]